jgi:hypothetical protein
MFLMSLNSTIRVTLDILGGIGFVLGSILAYFRLKDYLRPLRLLITFVDCYPLGNETSLVLYRLSFVNQSSQSQVVSGIDIVSKAKGISLIELKVGIETNLQTVTYSLPNFSYRLPFEETLQLPLYIPPNQCQNRWKAIGVSYPSVDPYLGTEIHFDAYNLVGKERIVWENASQLSWTSYRKKHFVGHARDVLFPAVARSRENETIKS